MKFVIPSPSKYAQQDPVSDSDAEMDEEDRAFVSEHVRDSRVREDAEEEEEEEESLQDLVLTPSVTFTDGRVTYRREQLKRKSALLELATKRRRLARANKRRRRLRAHSQTSDEDEIEVSPSSCRPRVDPRTSRGRRRVIVDEEESSDGSADDVDLDSGQPTPSVPVSSQMTLTSYEEQKAEVQDDVFVVPKRIQKLHGRLRAPIPPAATTASEKLQRYEADAQSRRSIPSGTDSIRGVLSDSAELWARKRSLIDQAVSALTHKLVHSSAGDNLAVIVDAKEAHATPVSRILRNHHSLIPIVTSTGSPQASYIVSESTVVVRMSSADLTPTRSSQVSIQRRQSGSQFRQRQIQELAVIFDRVYVIVEEITQRKLGDRRPWNSVSASTFLNQSARDPVSHTPYNSSGRRDPGPPPTRLTPQERLRLKLTMLPRVFLLDSFSQEQTAALINTLVRSEANIFAPFSASLSRDPPTSSAIPFSTPPTPSRGALRIPPRLWIAAGVGGLAADADLALSKLDKTLRTLLSRTMAQILQILRAGSESELPLDQGPATPTPTSETTVSSSLLEALGQALMLLLCSPVPLFP